MRSGFRFALATIAAGALLLGACQSVNHGAESRGPQRPDPSDPATGPVIERLESGDTTFALHDEGDGCLSVEILHPGLQRTVERACFDDWNALRITNTCGWLDESDQEETGDCDREIPSVIYGRVIDPDVGYVCVGTFGESGGSSGVTGARVLPRDDHGVIFTIAEPGESHHAHLLSRGGSRIGDPPLDAPSGPIYEQCEALANVDDPENVYGIDLAVTFDESLRSDDVTVFFHSGLDRIGVSGRVTDDGSPALLAVRVTPDVSRFSVDVEAKGEPTIAGLTLEWPDEVKNLLFSDEPCNDLTTVGVHVSPGVLDGSLDEPIDVTFLGSACSVSR